MNYSSSLQRIWVWTWTGSEKERGNPEITSLINRDLREGSRIGVRGTPTFFVNGKRLEQRSPEAFSAAIDDELNR